MNLFFGLTKRGSRVLLAGIASLVRLCLQFGFGGGVDHEDRLWEYLVKDPETILNKFHLDPFTRSYVSCPQCFTLYDSSAPDECTSKRTPTCNPCGAQLHKTRLIRGKPFRSPVCIYLHQSLKEWLGRFLSRPEVDASLDVPYEAPGDGFMYDIFDGYILQNFKAADGTVYIDRMAAPSGTRRLVFGLGVDGFNPYGNVIAKKKASSTGIYMVCYDLPPDLRYRPENMYLVGVIPGPNKPSLEQINNALQLLVDDLLPFWHPGVRYSRTAVHPRGRLINIALVPLVTDLMAARQVAGLGFPGHTIFCSCCRLPLHDIENFDPLTWPVRSTEDHVRDALVWRDAQSQKDREAIAKSTGARYSALLQLPYWDPIEFTTLDTMHNHYLGLLYTHIREVWAVDAEAEDGLGESHPTKKQPERPTREEMDTAEALLLAGSFATLEKMRRAVLYHLCLERDLRRASTKKVLMKSLRQWVRVLRVLHTETIVLTIC